MPKLSCSQPKAGMGLRNRLLTSSCFHFSVNDAMPCFGLLQLLSLQLPKVLQLLQVNYAALPIVFGVAAAAFIVTEMFSAVGQATALLLAANAVLQRTIGFH